MSTRARTAALCALLAVAPIAAGCTSSSHRTPKPTATTPSSGLTATRWWSNGAVTVGSTIDPSAPRAAVGKLHVSAADYCGMLRQTVAAGKSILPGVTAKDPALLASTQAFVAELEKVAPAAVSRSWQVLGGAVIALVESGGDTSAVKGIDAKAVAKAAAVISADAEHNCGVTLSAAK